MNLPKKLTDPEESFYSSLISGCWHVTDGTNFLFSGLDSFKGEFVTGVCDFLDFEDTLFFV